MSPMDILITGGAGQVGHELQKLTWPAHVRIHAPQRAELDLTDSDSIDHMLASRQWAAIINPAAYTAVDKAETEPDLAFKVNAAAPAYLACLAAQANIPLVHVSTDYVFSGELNRPYREDDAVGPKGVYGRSKLAGEEAIAEFHERHAIVRTAWVVSAHRANFLKTMLRLAEERDELRVVADQFGSPTGAADLAQALATITLRMIDDVNAPRGIFHFANAGSTHWAGLAQEIFWQSEARGGPHAEVVPISSADYPTPAKRPVNSCLNIERIGKDYGIHPRPWQAMVGSILDRLIGQELNEHVPSAHQPNEHEPTEKDAS